MSKPDEPARLPAEVWKEFCDRQRGLLTREIVIAEKIAPSRLADAEVAARGRATEELVKAGEKFMADLREWIAGLLNGKPTSPPPPPSTKEAKK